VSNLSAPDAAAEAETMAAEGAADVGADAADASGAAADDAEADADESMLGWGTGVARGAVAAADPAAPSVIAVCWCSARRGGDGARSCAADVPAATAAAAGTEVLNDWTSSNV